MRSDAVAVVHQHLQARGRDREDGDERRHRDSESETQTHIIRNILNWMKMIEYFEVVSVYLSRFVKV